MQQEQQIELIRQNLKMARYLIAKYGNLFNRIDKQDIESAVYFALFKATLKYNPNGGAQFKTYADRCIRNQVYELAKKKQFDMFVSLTEFPLDGSENEALQLEDFSKAVTNVIALKSLLSELEKRDREIVMDYYFEGLEQQQIALKHGLHVGSIQRIIRRCKEKMKKAAN